MVSWAYVFLVFGDAGLDLGCVRATLLLVGAQVLVTLYASRNYTIIACVVNNATRAVVLDECVLL